MNQEQIHYVPTLMKILPKEKGDYFITYEDKEISIRHFDGTAWHYDTDEATFWLEPQPIKEPLSFEEFLEKHFGIHRGKTMTDEMVGDFKLKYDGYLIGCKSPVSPIDREDIINQFTEECTTFRNTPISMPHYTKSPTEIVDWFISKGLLSKSEEKWISVDKELPKTSAWVLTYSPDTLCPTNPNYYMPNCDDWRTNKGNITHWQPLPTPPQISKI